MDLIKEFNLETYKQFTDGKKVLEANNKLCSYNSSIPRLNPVTLIDLQLMMTRYNLSARRMSTLYPFENLQLATSLDSQSLDTYLYSTSISATARAVMEVAVRAIFGFEASQLNALFGLVYGKSGGGSMDTLALTEKDCAQENRIKGGAQQISTKLLEAVQKVSNERYPTHVVFETALDELIQDNNDTCQLVFKSVKDNTKKSVFTAKKVISSIPTSEYTKIKFTPDLPFYKRNVFKFCQMGNYAKLIGKKLYLSLIHISQGIVR